MIKKYYKDYIKTWESVFKLEESLCRRDFWAFVCINYLFTFILWINSFSSFGQALRLIFFLSPILAGVKRMNDLKMSRYYAFIPFYSFYLCLWPKVSEENLRKVGVLLNLKTFFKIALFSFMIGVINFAWLLIRPNDLFYGLYIAFWICTLLYPSLTIIIILSISIFKKERITSEYLYVYFLLALIFTLVITESLLYYSTK